VGDFLAKLLKVDRRWIFLLLLLVMVIPVAKPLNLPGLKASGGVKGMYSYIEDLPEGSIVLVSFDFDPASKPELAPMGVAVLKHCFRKKHKVVSMGLWITGVGMAKTILDDEAKKADAKYGEDFVDIGFKPGGVAVITGMGEDIHSTFGRDARGNEFTALPLMQRVRRLKDCALVISLGAGSPGIDHWIAYGSDKHKFKMAGGTTAVNVPAMAPYLQAGQLVGLISAMRGAAEYESLMRFSGDATAGMDGISLGHYLIAFLIVGANIAHQVVKRRPQGAA
jgi:hypothetical protein